MSDLFTRPRRRGTSLFRRAISGTIAGVLLSGLAVAVAFVAAPAAAAAVGVSPVLQRTPAMVTTDALPTVQIDGVVWSEAVVGNTVYAGGNFANARPAGAAAGTNLTPRQNFLSFDLTTGNLNTSFVPSLNGQVKVVTASPDGSRVYVGGSFTQANGVNRYRIAAYSTSTGQLISTFAPTLDAAVNSISVTANAVYVGGTFSTANGVARSRLAAFSPTTGALLGWAPSADSVVQAVLVTPDGSRVIIGGAFLHIGSASENGMAAVDASSGAVLPWAADSVVKDGGSSASIMSLTTDGTAIYSTAYSLGSGNYEGVMSANPVTGAINWLADCHGDSYGSFPIGGTIYVVSHEHTCENIGGFPDTNPRTVWHRSTAFTTAATGIVKANDEFCCSYGNFAGEPSPSEYNWIPDIDIGTFTGQDQGAWSVNGNGQYVVEGGEFLHVNGTAQQGLVRFAVPSIAPDKQGPQVSGSALTTTAAAQSSTSVKVSWQTDWDRDDQNLTYSIYRQDQPSTPVYTVTSVSQNWNRPTISFVDPNVGPSTTYNYRVSVSDPSGNVVTGNWVAVTTPAGAGNRPPTAAFTTNTSGLAATFDGTGSNDPDGTIAGYSWNFGDGGTATGSQPSHTYGAAGTYTVTLTVTDNKGATGSVAHTVTVAQPGGPLASDSFTRTASSSWGTANTGGAWTVSPASAFSVNGSQGVTTLSTAGASATAALNGVSTSNLNLLLDSSLNKAATGNGVTEIISGRISGSSQYRLKLIYLAGGAVHLAWSKIVSGKETTVQEVVVSGLTYTPGEVLRLRLQLSGSGGTTSIAGKVWSASGAEPATPQLTGTDTEPTLQGAGAIGISTYLGSTSTSAPVAVDLDNLTVTAS